MNIRVSVSRLVLVLFVLFCLVFVFRLSDNLEMWLCDSTLMYLLFYYFRILFYFFYREFVCKGIEGEKLPFVV